MVQSLSRWLNDLFRMHHRDAVRFASRLVGSRDNGEEIVQNVWVSLCTRNPHAVIEQPKNYLLRATRNAAIDFAEREQMERNRRVDWDSLTEADVAHNSIRSYEQRRTLAVIAVSLNELPAACRKAFVMNKLQGYTHPEIAEHLNVSVSMVEKHIVRALFHCRDLMREDAQS